MKCLLHECENQATAPFKFCSGTHGYNFKNRQAEVQDWFDADEMIVQQAWYKKTQLEGNRPQRENYSVEEVIELTK